MMYRIEKKFTSTMRTSVPTEDAASHLKLLLDDPEFVERMHERLNEVCLDAMDEIMEVVRREHGQA